MYSFLLMLKYKCGWNKTTVVTLDQYEASTIICSTCGHRIKKLSTKIRKWTCPCCGTVHDRDINAAIVIKQKTENKLCIA